DHPAPAAIAHAELTCVAAGVPARALDDRRPHLASALDSGGQVIELEPQEDAVAVGPPVRVAEVGVLVSVPAVELQDHLARGVDDLVVLASAVAALAPEQSLVPPATRLDVPDGDQWLRLHGGTSLADSTI